MQNFSKLARIFIDFLNVSVFVSHTVIYTTALIVYVQMYFET